MDSVVIMGAAGRDFHNFNVYFRQNPAYRVAAFTATQIPDIAGRVYPPELAGPDYPEGIPIFAEEELPELIRRRRVDLVAFSYSDIHHQEVMHRASAALALGADFLLLGPRRTMLASRRPVVSVCAVRTGSGNSPTTRHLCRLLRQRGKNVVVVRHPMPYGDLRRQIAQRFTTLADLDRQQCTVEEREEYEPLLEEGLTVFAGVDYAQILRQAEAEAEIIVWDGGNNDLPFFRPDLHLVIFDPHRPGHELLYYPGETNLRLADVAIIHKSGSAEAEGVAEVRRNIAAFAPGAAVIEADLEIIVDRPELIRGRRVLVVEDGPTLTHGEMAYGAGVVAARRYGAAQIVEPCARAVGSLRETCRLHPHIRQALPAMGYSPGQLRDLRASIDNAGAETVVFATPARLPELLGIDQPVVRVRYAYRDRGEPTLEQVLESFLERKNDA